MKIESPLFALNSLARTQQALDHALKELSSGSRINSASDDPAGLSIATGLEAQLRGINQGVLNINESFGFLSTAEGSISTQMQITQRMRELAVNAATGTLSKTDRSYLNTEFQALLSEFTRIAEQTNFNGTKLLDGTFTTSNIQVGSTAQQVIPFSLGNTNSNQIFPTQTPGSSTSSTSTVGTGTFAAAKINDSFFGTGSQFVMGDFNGDGKLDTLTAEHANGVGLLVGNGDGTFHNDVSVAAVADACTVNAMDLNNDGKLDFIVSDVTNNRSITYLGNGDGTFTKTQTINNGQLRSPVGLATADLNGDGKVDLVIPQYGANDIAIYMGNGNGTFAAPTTLAVNPGDGFPFDVQLVDLNGDGKRDIVVADGFGGCVSTFLGNGNGTFQAEQTFGAGSYCEEVMVGDLNGDGKLDLVTEDSGDNTLSILIGNGDGTFKARTTLATGNNTHTYQQFGLILADLNGDGKLDLGNVDYNDSTVSVRLGNGDGTFKARTTLAGPNDPVSLQAADVNGDGVPDLMVISDSGTPFDYYTFLQNTTTTTTGSSTPGTNIPFDISTQTDASNILSVLDSGLTNLNAQRSNIGAYQSRLQSALAVNQITAENLAQAKSQILDTDVASATSDLVKDQIMQQAGVSVLAQANFQNQMILKLLNF